MPTAIKVIRRAVALGCMLSVMLMLDPFGHPLRRLGIA